MSEFVLLGTGLLLTDEEVRAAHRNVSFPQVMDAAACQFAGVAPVLNTPCPQGYERAGAVQDARGNWVQAWAPG